MISDCTGAQQWDLSGTETIFVKGVFALLKILIPVAIWVYTWKVCRTERAHPRTTMLGLEETTSQREQDKAAGNQVIAISSHLVRSRRRQR
jgi:hypothetical protein